MLESSIILEENLEYRYIDKDIDKDSNCILFPRCSQIGNDFLVILQWVWKHNVWKSVDRVHAAFFGFISKENSYNTSGL